MMIDQANASASPIPSELVRQDEEFADIVEEFLNSMPERLEQIRSALAKQDFDALKSYAHQLKGSGGGYGYPMLTAAAAHLEQQAAAAELEACQATVAELQNLASRLVLRAD